MRRLQNNIARWNSVDPKAAVFLQYVDCTHYHFCQTKSGERNLVKVENGKNYYFHSNENALQESQQWFSSVSLDDDILYVYGVGLGYYYEAARSWLKKKRSRRLVFLEDDLSVIHRLFETGLGTKILKDSQVHLYFFSDLNDPNSPITELYWKFLTTKGTFSALKLYATIKQDTFADLKYRVIYESVKRDATLDEYAKYGISFFRNFYPNIPYLAGAYLGDALAGKFKGLPVIICGAGPSLNKQLPLLASLSDKAIIIAGGSAVNALNSYGIQPHFGSGVDPNPVQLDRLKKNTAFEVPYFYRNRMYSEAFKLIHGPRLYVTSSGGYDISGWFEEKFGIKSVEIEEGHNVVNLCLDIVRVLGCNRVILLGMDLAYTNRQAYAEGIVDHVEELNKDILEAKDLDSRAFLKNDIYGKPIYTLWKWVTEADWIADFAKKNSEIEVINATEGGIGMTHVKNMPFAEVIEKYLVNNYDIRNRVHGEIQNAALPNITREQIMESLKELEESLQRCIHHLEILIQEANNMLEKTKKTKQPTEQIQTGLAVLAEIELAEEIGYRYILDMFNAVTTMVYTRDLQKMRASQEWKKTVNRLNITIKKLSFLKNVAIANCALINDTLK